MSIEPTTQHDALIAQTRSSRFGELLAPEHVDALENKISPNSLQKLSIESAALLKSFVKATEDGLLVTGYVYSEIPILWIVDKNDEIWFAIEEIIDPKTLEFVMPRLRNTNRPDGLQRLGHPALIGAREGRIGGEILFDVRGKPARWVISNASGRYGLKPGRQPEQLSAAKQEFLRYGIDLMEFFIARRS